MNVTHENFIGIYENVFSDELCDDLIQHYENCKRHNVTYGRESVESEKKDESVCVTAYKDVPESISLNNENVSGIIGEFNDKFWNICYKDYVEQYSVLDNYGPHTIFTYKIQKTVRSGGYHVWHAEDGSSLVSKRLGVYILYLNDVEEGGETEFLYMSQRVKPKKGTLLIFPPNYPWTHRGNPPLSGEKYIMTGWTEYK